MALNKMLFILLLTWIAYASIVIVGILFNM